MNKINILLIEDTPEEANLLNDVLINNGYNITGVAKNFEQALVMFNESDVDLVIVDIFLDGVPDGIKFAQTINIIPNISKPFLFLSSSRDRTIFDQAKLTKPFAFLLKPFNELEVLYAIEMALEKYYEQKNIFTNGNENALLTPEYLFIKKKNVLKKVDLKDIIYIEVEDRYCNIVTATDKFVILISLTKIIEILDPKSFRKTHRNFIVNINKIQSVTLNDNLILMEGGFKVMISSSYKDFIQEYKILK